MCLLRFNNFENDSNIVQNSIQENSALPTSHPKNPDCEKVLFYRNRFGQVPGLIDITTSQNGNMVRKQLKRNGCQ